MVAFTSSCTLMLFVVRIFWDVLLSSRIVLEVVPLDLGGMQWPAQLQTSLRDRLPSNSRLQLLSAQGQSEQSQLLPVQKMLGPTPCSGTQNLLHCVLLLMLWAKFKIIPLQLN